MLFINTRPASRAKKLTEFLQAQAIEVVELPLLELVAKPLDDSEQQALKQVAQAKAIILVSEDTVKYGLTALAEKIDLATVAQSPLTWIAVGQKTADYFNQLWRDLTDTPPPNIIFPFHKHEQNNEGLLKLSQIQSLKTGDNVQIWRGIGGRELVADTLSNKGITVKRINFYQRRLPRSTIKRFKKLEKQLAQEKQRVVLISSLTAWQHWQKLVVNTSFPLSHCHYIVLQSRIATLMKEDVAEASLTVIDDLQLMTIMSAMPSAS